MFETWPYAFEPAPWRVVSPPLDVQVDLASAIARTPPGFGASRPLRVRAEGLNLDTTVPARLDAWARVSAGDWLCRLTFRVPTGNEKGYLDMQIWCGPDAVTPAENMQR